MKTAFASLLLLSFAGLGADTNELRLAPPYGELQPTFWELHQTSILVSVIVLILLVDFLIWWSFQPKGKPILPPEQIARTALVQMQTVEENGKALSEISQILRRYVGAVFGFSGGEMTTTEFLAVIAKQPRFDPELAETLAVFLKACDKNKFAAENATPPLNAVERALQLVDLIERTRQQADASKPNP